MTRQELEAARTEQALNMLTDAVSMLEGLGYQTLASVTVANARDSLQRQVDMTHNLALPAHAVKAVQS